MGRTFQNCCSRQAGGSSCSTTFVGGLKATTARKSRSPRSARRIDDHDRAPLGHVADA
jgi:hypothetical protein